ncbi:MAG: methyl-accepting chemotaxis protein [Bacillus sp. (in: firmicutes)]
MEAKKTFKFGLRKKLAFFITIVALITYSTSGLFIYILYPMLFSDWNEVFFTLMTLLLGIIWSGIIAFFAAGIIIKPLQRLEKIALRAAHGNIKEDLEVSKSDDEIRSLGIAFNHMLYSLRDMVQSIDHNFQETNDKVIRISDESVKAAEQATSISRTIREISLGADNSAISIQNTAESVDEIIGIAKDVQEKARSSVQTSAEMVEELMKSKEVIHSLTAGIQKLALENKESLSAVQRLEEHAKKVEHIIQLVGDIAGQTNLLALNASIEAARAGDHGKGFAVVAEEVRLLADESAKAVQGIAELIQNIQAEVQVVVQQIGNQVKTANQEAEKGQETNKMIEEMTATVYKVAEAVKDITKLVDQQMSSIEQTSMQSQEVAAIAEETSAGAEEVAAATQEQTTVIQSVEQLAVELREQAERLRQMITRFKA